MFVFLMAIHQWYVDNQFRYAIVEDTLTILRIIIGVQFAVGVKIVIDAFKAEYPLSATLSFMLITVALVFLLPLMAIVAVFLKTVFMG